MNTYQNVNNIIAHNIKIWGEPSAERKKNKVFLTMVGEPSVFDLAHSYYGNILAKYYDAELIAGPIKRYADMSEYNALIYSSFGTREIYPIRFSQELLERAQTTAEQTMKKMLHSKDDLLNICIDGINYGFELYRTYIRLIDTVFDKEKNYQALRNLIMRTILTIYRYRSLLASGDVKALVLTDALYDEAIVKLMAWKYGVDVYSVDVGIVKRILPGDFSTDAYRGIDLSEKFNELTEQEQNEGKLWAKERLAKRLSGNLYDASYVSDRSNNIFKKPEGAHERILCRNNKIKVVICPHCVFDDPFPYGKFLFKDHYEWLCYLGDLASETDYDWYLKIHPDADKRTLDFWKIILDKYPHIKPLQKDTSVYQMKEEGMAFALTLWGTLGHEYPAMGIQVINGGPNPHENFDFDWNPKTFSEYDYLLRHLRDLHKDINLDEIYAYYYMHYKKMLPAKAAVDDLFYSPEVRTALKAGDEFAIYRASAYEGYLRDFSQGQHEHTIAVIKKRLSELGINIAAR